MKAIILSGSHRDVSQRLGEVTKCLLEINNRPALDLIIEAFTQCDALDSIYIIGPQEIVPIVEKWNASSSIPVSWIPAPERLSMFENLMHAYHHIVRSDKSAESDKFFFSCADVPFLSKEIISDFIRTYGTCTQAIITPIVDLDICEELEKKVKKKIPSVVDHMPLCFDGGLYHLGNLGLIEPAKITEYWMDILKLSRDTRNIGPQLYFALHPKRIKLLTHLLKGFFMKRKASNIGLFVNFTYQIFIWLIAIRYFKKGQVDKTRQYALKIKSHFLFKRFLPEFGLAAYLPVYNRPEVFIDFDTAEDVQFINDNYIDMMECFQGVSDSSSS